jgi:hypothetical protein
MKMNDEAQLLSTIWDAIEGYISTNEKQEAAEAIIKTLIDNGNDLPLLQDAEGNCNYLDRALAAVESEQEEVETDLYDEYGEI